MKKTIILFCAQGNQGRNKLHCAFLTESAARAQDAQERASRMKAASSYEESLQNGDIVHFELDAKVHERIAKTGVAFVSFDSNLRGKEATPLAVSSSKSGLVAETKRIRPGATAFTLFRDSQQAGAFLIEGYPVPPGLELSRFNGSLLSKKI
jgi:hypothetical protein